LARLCESSSLLTSGITVGTPSYMAPEQCRGGPLDARVDVYACGVVLFEMLAGRKPFIAPDPLAIVKKQLTEEPPLLGDVAPDAGVLEDVCARALAKDPDKRFASAIEMASAIEAAVPQRISTIPPTPIPEPAVLRSPPIPMLGSSAVTPIVENDESIHLPPSRMKWAALFLVLFVIGSIYGIVRVKQYLAEQTASQR